ncbi:GNAT family N-acetyltransferase [Spirillospora sp. NBC_01491]|uniref:GNAT family N-acetyltransferase n=1 Tax=Spirillospora sp. NBC_01491 TaxID=2976007 RepID=UPI002E353818|nr:GNAT family N-acetyltransferase [Spirillospora sp. NBC_01491]
MTEVRELRELDELEALHRLIGDIWRPAPGAEPIQVEMLRALAHAGNYVAGAFSGDGRMVGLSVAFLADPPGVALHSHITGAVGGRGVGLALKLHQREWALARGLSRITWTYDPLVRRNAYFNLVKLGARPGEYLPSFYGTIEDSINAGDETDRVLAVWPLPDPRVVAATRGEHVPVPVPDDAATALGEKDGWPVRGGTDASTLLVAVPEDIEGLRRSAPEAARAWRTAVRDVLGGLLDDGARVTGFHRRTSYVVERSEGTT